MIPRAQLIAERRMLAAFLEMPTLPGRIWRAPSVVEPRKPRQRPKPDISMIVALARDGEKHEYIAEICGCTAGYVSVLARRAGLRRYPPRAHSLSAGCSRPSEASREARLAGVSSLTSSGANAAGFSHPDRAGANP